MKLVIVGNKDGKHKVLWLNYFILLILAALITGFGTGLAFYFLAHRWNHSSVMFGLFIGVSTISVGLINSLRTPVKKLTVLN